MIYKIPQELEELGLIKEGSTRLYSTRTRDSETTSVYKDESSGILFIKNPNYDETVFDNHRGKDSLKPLYLDMGRQVSLKRRVEETKQYYVNKFIADFGCGHGDFLRAVSKYTQKSIGVELSKNERDLLNSDDIECFSDISSIEYNSLDTIFLFHVLEHLPSQIDFLKLFRSKLKANGTIIIEVPHARDFLLSELECEAYKNFTLWSQHLILHTRESLKTMLQASGFSQIIIRGIQRYPISNHFEWLKNSRPGGHLKSFSNIDSIDLSRVYENSLNRIDATDTLFAVACPDS